MPPCQLQWVNCPSPSGGTCARGCHLPCLRQAKSPPLLQQEEPIRLPLPRIPPNPRPLTCFPCWAFWVAAQDGRVEGLEGGMAEGPAGAQAAWRAKQTQWGKGSAGCRP